MKESKKIFKNYVYNVIYQIFLLIVPLVLTPYVSRVLRPSGVGEYSFANSIISYFVIVSSLGFGFYAQREISRYQGDKINQTRIFWEINIVRLFPVLLCLSLNVILAFTGVYESYKSLMFILSINILAVAFDITFLFQGNEQFSKIVIRNVLIKTAGIVTTILFVKTENDLLLYAMINVLMLIVSNLSLWLYLPKILVKVEISSLHPFNHLKGTLSLFLPTIVMSLYTILDKTLIGVILKDNTENGYYEQAQKLVNLALTFVNCLGVVMIPRNGNEYQKGNFEKVKANIYFSTKFVWFIGVPILLGFILIAPLINSWFFGAGYEKVINMMILFSPIILITGFNGVIGIQYFISIHKEKTFTIAVVLAAIINITLSSILLFYIGTIGAIVATVISEMVILAFLLFNIRKDFSISKIFFMGIKNVIAGLVMFVPLYFFEMKLQSSILNTFIITGLGIIIYFIVLLILRDQMLYKGINLIISFLKKNKKED